MNDRFKFRVWNKIKKTYSDIPYGSYALSDSGELLWIESNCDCSETNTEDYIVEQCTGLHDENGKLIFEGDVVRINGMQERFEVVYSENLCGFGLKHADGMITSVTPSVLGGVEVIGNIHKNEEFVL